LRPSLGGNPLEFRDETYPWKTRGMGLLYGENCVILASTVFDWSTRVTDRQTDRIAMAYTRYSIYAVARKNWWVTWHDDDLSHWIEIWWALIWSSNPRIYYANLCTEGAKLYNSAYFVSLYYVTKWAWSVMLMLGFATHFLRLFY